MSGASLQTPFERYPTLGTRLAALEAQKKGHFEIGRQLLTVVEGDVYVTDLVMLGILKRSVDIIDGAIALVKRWNFTAAAPLLRLQLDSVLRLSYISCLEDAEAFCREILAGKSFRDMRDGKNAKLTDRKLREYAKERYPWIDHMYYETSKMVHLSDKHFFLPVREVNVRERTVGFLDDEGPPH